MTQYDDYMTLISSEHDSVEEEKKKFKERAKDWVPKLFEALKAEGLEKDDARDKIEKDCLMYWSKDTIRKFLPIEAKDAQKVEAGKKGKEKQLEEKQKQTITTNGQTITEDNSARTDRADYDSIWKKKEESDSFKPDFQTADNIKSEPSQDDSTTNEIKPSIQSHEVPPYITLKLQELDTTKQRLKESLARIDELENKLQDHAFDVIKNTRDDIRHGTYDLEYKDRTYPLKWNYSLTTGRMVIEFDHQKSKWM